MENLEGAVDSAPLVDKVEDDGFQFELQSLGEIERQYADHSVMRDAQLTILREKVAKNDVILNELRADMNEKQMDLERRTDAYTALIPLRNQILELRSQGQALFNAASNEEEISNAELKNAETVLKTYSPCNDEILGALANEESSIITQIEEIKKIHQSAINDLKIIPKDLMHQADMEKVCLDFEEDIYNMIKLLKNLVEENEKMSMGLEKMDLGVLKEEHDRLEALNESKKQVMENLNIQRVEIQDRIKVLKETNEEKLVELNKVDYELEIHGGYRKEFDEKIAELGIVKENMEKEIEALNGNWNDCDSVHSERLNQLEEELENEMEKLEAMRKTNQNQKAKYDEAKQVIVKEYDLEKDHGARSAEYKEKIQDLVEKKEKVLAKIEEINESKVVAERIAEEMKVSLRDSNLQLEKMREERLGLRQRLDDLLKVRENEQKTADGLVRVKNELSEEKSHLIELKSILIAGVKRVEEKFDGLDLPSMDDVDKADLKTPGVGEKMIEDLAKGLEKWKEDVQSLSEKGIKLLDEKNRESSLDNGCENVEKLRNEILDHQEQLSAKKRSAANIDNELAKIQRERDELFSVLKVKQNQLADEKKLTSFSQEFVNDENSDPNIRPGRFMDSDSD